MKVTMSWAKITPQGKANVNEVLESGWLSRHKFIPQFEKAVAKLHKARHGIFMNSGTDALRIALLTLKEVHQWRNNDEVIIPGLTFVATANAVLQSGLRPVFVDVQMETGNIEPKAIVKHLTRSTRAIVAVHLFGLPASMPAVMEIARTHRLRVIEDSCETFGIHRLTGDMACFSFYVAHHVQCGVGGMILADNNHYERVARSYMNHGRVDDGSHFKFGRNGFSSRATEMEAALGYGALQEFIPNLAKRRMLANWYINQLAYVKGLIAPKLWHGHSWMFMPILMRKGQRDDLLQFLRQNEIESREAMPIINQPCFKMLYKKGSCPNAEEWTKKGILLPLHPLMDGKQIDYVCDKVREFFK